MAAAFLDDEENFTKLRMFSLFVKKPIAVGAALTCFYLHVSFLFVCLRKPLVNAFFAGQKRIFIVV